MSVSGASPAPRQPDVATHRHGKLDFSVDDLGSTVQTPRRPASCIVITNGVSVEKCPDVAVQLFPDRVVILDNGPTATRVGHPPTPFFVVPYDHIASMEWAVIDKQITFLVGGPGAVYRASQSVASGDRAPVTGGTISPSLVDVPAEECTLLLPELNVLQEIREYVTRHIRALRKGRGLNVSRPSHDPVTVEQQYHGTRTAAAAAAAPASEGVRQYLHGEGFDNTATGVADSDDAMLYAAGVGGGYLEDAVAARGTTAAEATADLMRRQLHLERMKKHEKRHYWEKKMEQLARAQQMWEERRRNKDAQRSGRKRNGPIAEAAEESNAVIADCIVQHNVDNPDVDADGCLLAPLLNPYLRPVASESPRGADRRRARADRAAMGGVVPSNTGTDQNRRPGEQELPETRDQQYADYYHARQDDQAVGGYSLGGDGRQAVYAPGYAPAQRYEAIHGGRQIGVDYPSGGGSPVNYAAIMATAGDGGYPTAAGSRGSNHRAASGDKHINVHHYHYHVNETNPSHTSVAAEPMIQYQGNDHHRHESHPTHFSSVHSPSTQQKLETSPSGHHHQQQQPQHHASTSPSGVFLGQDLRETRSSGHSGHRQGHLRGHSLDETNSIADEIGVLSPMAHQPAAAPAASQDSPARPQHTSSSAVHQPLGTPASPGKKKIGLPPRRTSTAATGSGTPTGKPPSSTPAAKKPPTGPPRKGATSPPPPSTRADSPAGRKSPLPTGPPSQGRKTDSPSPGTEGGPTTATAAASVQSPGKSEQQQQQQQPSKSPRPPPPRRSPSPQPVPAAANTPPPTSNDTTQASSAAASRPTKQQSPVRPPSRGGDKKAPPKGPPKSGRSGSPPPPPPSSRPPSRAQSTSSQGKPPPPRSRSTSVVHQLPPSSPKVERTDGYYTSASWPGGK